MKRHRRVLAAAGALLFAFSADAALAQKQGGILRVPHFDSPASMSLLEESTVAVNRPMMGVFNNLVMYKQDVPQNSLKSIVPGNEQRTMKRDLRVLVAAGAVDCVGEDGIGKSKAAPSK